MKNTCTGLSDPTKTATDRRRCQVYEPLESPKKGPGFTQQLCVCVRERGKKRRSKKGEEEEEEASTNSCRCCLEGPAEMGGAEVSKKEEGRRVDG